MLNNVIRKLKEDKKATIVYLGGSVTGGFGSSNASQFSWRALSGKHFVEQFPDAEIKLVNAGVGGTGTGYARFRLQKDVLDHNPDLVFIEFSINDSYEGYNVETSKLYYESLIHTINKANPNTDIVMVVITDRGNMRNGPCAIPTLHYSIAERYGIPVVDILSAVSADMKANEEHNEDYFLKDWAHPNDEGYAFYASVVNKFIDENIVAGEYGDYKPHTYPEAESANIILGDTASILPQELNVTLVEGFNLKEVSEGKFIYESENAGDSLEFDFSGTHFSAWVKLGGVDRQEGGADAVECYVDGKLLETVTVKSWSGATVHRHIIHAIEDGEHSVRLFNKDGGKFVIEKFFFA